MILTYYFYFQVSVSVLICWPHYPYKVKYCLYKNRAGEFYQVEKVEFLNLIIHDCQLLNGLKISYTDQLILAVKFRFGVNLVQTIGHKV